MKRRTLIALVIGIVIVINIFVFTNREKNPVVENMGDSQDRRTVLVYFLDNNNPATTTSCGITRGVVRDVGKSRDIYTLTIKKLFEGPTAIEQSEGLISPTKELEAHFIDLSIVTGTAYLNFKQEALQYLSSAACMQESVKRPLENTLKQFPEVQKVEYMINGEVYDAWDA